MTRIRFHIGAHKTATTHLQMTLAGCRFTEGTRYVPLKPLRRFLTRPVRKGPAFLPWHRWYRGTWLFSDENILGNSENVRRMYHDPAAALGYFADCELELFMAVRSYDSFLPSAWGERLWRHRIKPFDVSMPQRRWPDVVADLQAALPDVAIHVWRYEDYRRHAEAILRYYAADAIKRFPAPLASRPKSGFSGRAVAEIERHAGRKLGRRRLRAIRRRFPVGEDYPRFDPWTDAQKRTLREMYEADLDKLSRQVEVWTP